MVEVWLISITVLLVFIFVIIAVIMEKSRALVSLIGAFFIVLIIYIWSPSIPSTIHVDFGEFISENIRILTLIIGLMLIVEIFLESGVFEYMALKMIKITKGSPPKLFIIFLIFTFGMSTIMANVGAILIIVPLTITTCNILRLKKALPYFIIGEQISTVASGIVLPISSIPNIIISTDLGFQFIDFLIFSAPFSLIILVFLIVFIKKIYLDKEDRLEEPPSNLKAFIDDLDEGSVIIHKDFFKISIGILITLIILILIIPDAAHLIVMFCVLFLFIFSKLEVEKILKKIDWNTVFFLIGLFIIINTMKSLGILDYIGIFINFLSGGNIVIAAFLTLWICGITSGVVDNIPITLTLTTPVNNIL
ncbi:MAG: SLC13 family permease, partial [Candidatus Helarchaeota archaeon]